MANNERQEQKQQQQQQAPDDAELRERKHVQCAVTPLIWLEQGWCVVWPHYLQGPQVTKCEPENVPE